VCYPVVLIQELDSQWNNLLKRKVLDFMLLKENNKNILFYASRMRIYQLKIALNGLIASESNQHRRLLIYVKENKFCVSTQALAA